MIRIQDFEPHPHIRSAKTGRSSPSASRKRTASPYGRAEILHSKYAYVHNVCGLWSTSYGVNRLTIHVRQREQRYTEVQIGRSYYNYDLAGG